MIGLPFSKPLEEWTDEEIVRAGRAWFSNHVASIVIIPSGQKFDSDVDQDLIDYWRFSFSPKIKE